MLVDQVLATTAHRAVGDKVDGIAALAMAVSRAIVQVEQRSVYEDRGAIVL
jgi:hypothetical protein